VRLLQRVKPCNYGIQPNLRKAFDALGDLGAAVDLKTGNPCRSEMFMQPLQLVTCTAPTPRVEIYSLGQLEILIDGVAVRMDGRGPRKPLELLGMLIAVGPRGASISTVADGLWPEADGFDAYRSLITTVYRLRRLLRFHDAIRLGAGRIRLERTICDVDVWRFEHAISAARTQDRLRAALSQYLGPFMEETENAWVIGVRKRLQQAITQAVRAIDTSVPA
jgi:DNA-binding SARP family transcriptional activator